MKFNKTGKPFINYGKRLGMWKTLDKVAPNRLYIWELDMITATDLLLYDKDTAKQEVVNDIVSYYGKTLIELGFKLKKLSAEEVKEKYLTD